LEGESPEAWQPHPVFYFDFNNKNYQQEDALEAVLDKHLRKWEAIYGGDCRYTLEERFQVLLENAASKTGRNAVVLVDEYDKPLMEALNREDEAEHERAVYKAFFGTLKTSDQYLKFAFFTGVTKFSKVSIFSDLNQLEDISMDADYAGLCGITEEEMKDNFAEEIRRMAEENGLSEEECLIKLRKTYDGYHFATGIEKGVYNPYSLLNAFKKRRFGYFWYETGTPTFLVNRIGRSTFDVKKFTDGKLYSTAFHRRNCILERCQLLLRIRLVLAVGRGKMGEHPFDFQPRQLGNPCRQLPDFLRAHADTPHARVHLQMDAGFFLLALCLLRQCLS
jgi:hypothetical protein